MGRGSTGTVEVRKASIRLKFTPVPGQPRVTEVLAHTDEKAARRLLDKIQYAIKAGNYRREDFFETTDPGRSENPTFREYATQWLATSTKAKSTRRLYKSAMTGSWYPAFGDTRLKQLRYSDITAALAGRLKVVGPQTMNNHLSPLRECLRAAVRDKIITDSPADGVGNQEVQKEAPDPFTREECDAILAHIKAKYDDRVWAYWTFMFHTGLRPSEAIALQWADVDWNKRKLKVCRAIVDAEEKKTKTNRVRFVDLSDVALAALQTMKAHTFMKNTGVIFENPNTRSPWASELLPRKSYFNPTLKALGIRHRDAYSTRHTFATRLLMGGVNPTYISKQLGHASLAMLFTVYGTWIEDADGGAEARKLNAVLSQAPAEPSQNCPTADAIS